MKASDLLHKLLELEPTWQVTNARDDLGKQQIDIWVGEAASRNWFFGQKAAPGKQPERVWRHINFGTWRCFVHAALPAGNTRTDLPWCGDGEMPFTRAMSRQIATLLWEGMKFQTICATLDIPVAELWKFKHSLDSGKVGLSAPSAAAPPVAANAAPSAVPDPDDPVWEKLLDGSLNIEIRVLSLKLLLTKLREQMRVITDSEVRLLKTHEIQRYFVRYEPTLTHELAQLRQS